MKTTRTLKRFIGIAALGFALTGCNATSNSHAGMMTGKPMGMCKGKMESGGMGGCCTKMSDMKTGGSMGKNCGCSYCNGMMQSAPMQDKDEQHEDMPQHRM